MTQGLKTFAEFAADFPDPEWDRHGGDDYPAGRPIAVWLRDTLTREGFRCSEVENHDSYGWAFDVSVERATIWCMLQSSERWLLITQCKRKLLDALRGRSCDAEHRRLLDAIVRALEGDPRVRDSAWFARADYQAQASRR